jgi:hypothetical protein
MCACMYVACISEVLTVCKYVLVFTINADNKMLLGDHLNENFLPLK